MKILCAVVFVLISFPALAGDAPAGPAPIPNQPQPPAGARPIPQTCAAPLIPRYAGAILDLLNREATVRFAEVDDVVQAKRVLETIAASSVVPVCPNLK